MKTRDEVRRGFLLFQPDPRAQQNRFLEQTRQSQMPRIGQSARQNIEFIGRPALPHAVPPQLVSPLEADVVSRGAHDLTERLLSRVLRQQQLAHAQIRCPQMLRRVSFGALMAQPLSRVQGQTARLKFAHGLGLAF